MEDRSWLAEGTCWKNKKTGEETGFVIDVQKKKGIVTFRFFQSDHHVGSFENIPSHSKMNEKNTEFTVGSIWCPFNPKNQIVKLTRVDTSYITYVDIETGEKHSMICDEFLKKFKHSLETDVSAIYENREDPLEWVVITSFRDSGYNVNYSHYGGDYNGREGVDTIENFHKQYKIVTFYPFEMDIAELFLRADLNNPSKNVDVPLSKHIEWAGKVWYSASADADQRVAVTIKEENGIVWYVLSSVTRMLDEDNYWQMPINGWFKAYKPYEGVKPPFFFPEWRFDKRVKYVKGRYERVIEKLKEGERKMENSKETYLKTDTSKLKDFGTGAKREDKTGKGRYDLIPGDVMSELEDFAWETYFNNGVTTCSATDVSKSAYFDDWTNVELYYDFIVNVISYFFAKDHIECTDDCGEISYEVNWDIFRSGLYEMRKQLALHYEAGAVVHGVDNWKKGLPVYGSARGGCFLDSMRRHIDQALMGLTDEPHAVAALWNAFCAVWTLEHRPNSAMYQNSSAVKAEEKFSSTHFDMIDSVIDALKYMNKDKDAALDTEITTPSDYNDIIKDLREVSEANRIEEYNKMILKYYDVRYNLLECIKVLRDIVTSKNFSRLNRRVTTVYFDIYSTLVILHDIINWFHEDEKAIDHIAKIITDIHDMINMGAGHICSYYKIKKLEWETCPENLRGFAVVLCDPDEDKLNILYETIDRAVCGLLNRDEKGFDPFCGLGITQSLAKFNTDCLESRVYKK